MNMIFMQGENNRFFRGQDLILRGGKGAQFSWGQGNRLFRRREGGMTFKAKGLLKYCIAYKEQRFQQGGIWQNLCSGITHFADLFLNQIK
jgi:hypothetical protein